MQIPAQMTMTTFPADERCLALYCILSDTISAASRQQCLQSLSARREPMGVLLTQIARLRGAMSSDTMQMDSTAPEFLRNELRELMRNSLKSYPAAEDTGIGRSAALAAPLQPGLPVSGQQSPGIPIRNSVHRTGKLLLSRIEQVFDHNGHQADDIDGAPGKQGYQHVVRQVKIDGCTLQKENDDDSAEPSPSQPVNFLGKFLSLVAVLGLAFQLFFKDTLRAKTQKPLRQDLPGLDRSRLPDF